MPGKHKMDRTINPNIFSNSFFMLCYNVFVIDYFEICMNVYRIFFFFNEKGLVID